MCQKAPFRGVNGIVGDLFDNSKSNCYLFWLLILIHLGVFIAMRISSN